MSDLKKPPLIEKAAQALTELISFGCMVASIGYAVYEKYLLAIYLIILAQVMDRVWDD